MCSICLYRHAHKEVMFMSEVKYCSNQFELLDKLVNKTYSVENCIPGNTTFCPFFRLRKKLYRCRSPPFINFELKKFEIDRRK